MERPDHRGEEQGKGKKHLKLETTEERKPKCWDVNMDDLYIDMPGIGKCICSCTIPKEEEKHKKHEAFKHAPVTSQN